MYAKAGLIAGQAFSKDKNSYMRFNNIILNNPKLNLCKGTNNNAI